MKVGIMQIHKFRNALLAAFQPIPTRAVATAPNIKTLDSTVYGGRHTVTLIPGDGIGPEMTGYVKEAIRFAGAPVDFEEIGVNQKSSEDQMQEAVLAVLRNGVALKGNIESDLVHNLAKSKNVALRKGLDLYANIVRCKSVPSYRSRHSGIDVVIVRENAEGEYSQLEHESVKGVVESLKIITEENSTRIAKYAFDYAIKHNKTKVTAVHKANIMKKSDGLFLECCNRVAKLYPSIIYSTMIIDNCAMQMVSKPQQFEVVVTGNLYGNILANIGTGLVGGPGVTIGSNIGNRCAVFEQGARNSGRSLIGKNVANPAAMLLASAEMLNHIGLDVYGNIIYTSVFAALENDRFRTPDLGGNATTLEVIQEIFRNIKDLSVQT